jgi:hypothetical protein
VEQILDEVEQALAEDGALKRERRALGTQGQRTARALGRGIKALLDPKPGHAWRKTMGYINEKAKKRKKS